jgi:uncharacterized protein (TIGR03067 family)
MFWCSVLLVLAPLGDGAPPEDAVKRELQQFQGSWKAVSIRQADGLPAPEEDVQNTRLVVEGSKFRLTCQDYTVSGTFAIDPARTPKAIDVVLTSEDGSQTKLLGIYEIKGDTRKSCFAPPGMERPARFSSEKGFFGFEWKRN